MTSHRLRELLARSDSALLKRLDQIERDLADPEGAPPTPEAIHVWLNPLSISERVEEQAGRLARGLEQLRNVLTIAPLAVTWLSLALAMANYSYLSDRQLLPDQASFLSVWQRGFYDQGFLPAPTFTEMAVVDVLLLSLLLVVTLLLHVASQYASGRGQEIQHVLEQRVPELMNAAAARRQGHEYGQLGRALAAPLVEFAESQRDVVGCLREVLTDLRGERERLVVLGQEREQEYSELAAFVVDLKSSFGQLAGQIESLGVLAAQLTDVSRGLAGLETLRDDLKENLRDMVGQSVGLTEAIRLVLDSHGQLDATLAGFNDRVTEQMTAWDSRQRTLDELTRAIAEQARQLEEKLTLLILRVPSARSVADEVAGAWALAQAQHLSSLNRQLEATLHHFGQNLDSSLSRLREGSD